MNIASFVTNNESKQGLTESGNTNEYALTLIIDELFALVLRPVQSSGTLYCNYTTKTKT